MGAAYRRYFQSKWKQHREVENVDAGRSRAASGHGLDPCRSSNHLPRLRHWGRRLRRRRRSRARWSRVGGPLGVSAVGAFLNAEIPRGHKSLFNRCMLRCQGNWTGQHMISKPLTDDDDQDLLASMNALLVRLDNGHTLAAARLSSAIDALTDDMMLKISGNRFSQNNELH